MVLSYSLMIVLEVLILAPLFSYLLFTQKGKTLVLAKSHLLIISTLLLAGAMVLFLVPKISLLSEFDYTKLTADAWDHYLVTKSWSNTGVIETDMYPYYAKFPIVYVPQIVLHQISGLTLFDSMTIFYLAAGVAGLFIINGIAKEIMKGPRSERLIFAGISCVVYSFLQYLNLIFAQQYPLALATVAGLFCIYAFVSLTNKRKRAILYLCIAGIMLSLCHPFAPIFMSFFFFAYFMAGKIFAFKRGPYPSLISKRVAVFMSLALFVSGLTYAMIVTTGTFERGVEWSGRNAQYTFEKLSSQLFESTTSGVGQSFEGRYDALETIIYPLNWALPAASSLSMVILYLFGRSRVVDNQLSLLFPLAVVSTFMFMLTFAFSFVEFAFSRYFGAFALVFNVPLTSYVILKIVKFKISVVKYPMLAVVALAIASSVTDPSMIPYVGDGNQVIRNTAIYPSQLDLVAWDDFYSLFGDQPRIVETNLNAGPINYYQKSFDYQNEIITNPKNYTAFNDNSYLIIDKDKFDNAPELQDSPLMDRVYDNSKIYLVR